MMNDWLLLVVLLLAVAIGWLLGRFGSKKPVLGQEKSEDYLRGLDFVLQEQPDEAIDEFLTHLAVNSETVDTHLALGRFFRSKGEVDKATLVHQNLLARPALSKAKALAAQYELARDYMAAGLFDRAERLLIELSGQTSEFTWAATELLIDIYQREKEWQLALEVATKTSFAKRLEIRPVLAQFCCELVEEKQKTGELNEVKKLLKQALRYDPQCIRASVLLGRFELSQGQYKSALKALLRIVEQDADYLPLVLADIEQAHHALKRDEAYVELLEGLLEDRGMLSAAVSLAEKRFGVPLSGPGQQFLLDYLHKHPTLQGVAYWSASTGRTNGDSGEKVAQVVQRLVEYKPVHACADCGFEVKKMTWHCPGCRQWGSIKPIYGFEGE